MSHGSQIKTALGISALVSFYGIASLLIWFGGSYFDIGMHWQIIIIALLLITWPFAILINHFRKKRAARKEAAAMSAAAQGQPGAPQPAAQAASSAPRRVYEELARGAEEAVQWLRSTRLGGSKGGSDAVYGLPWFLVAGPPASGKTSLVLGSGLDFHALPSQRRTEAKIVRPTQHCEWRVTDSAVLIDTTGRYQNDGPPRDEWLALTDTIKRYRNNRPLDGLVVAVNADRLLRSNENDIEQQAKTIRARLDEILQRVRARFPVYLVFTHIDTVEGFREFFAARRRDGRGEVWGATITLDKTANAHALFDVEFDQLCDSLNRLRLLRLAAPAAPAQQLRVFNFPARFARARSRLGLFTSAVFRPNPFSESPMLRGFYFTASVSGAAAPRPDDGGDGSERGPQAVGEGFFIDKLFREVLLRDGNLAAAFQANQKRPPRLGTILVIVAVLFLFLLAFGSTISFFANRALVAEAVEHGSRVDEIIKADAGKDPLKKEAAAARVEVEAMDSLRETLAELDNYQENSPPFHMRFGLYSGNSINPPLRYIYFGAITQRYFKPTVAAIEKDLQAFISAAAPTVAVAASDEQSSSAEDVLGKHYDLLKAYLMLSDPEKVEPTFLASQLEEYWKRSSPPDMEIVSLQQLEFYSRQAGDEDAPQAPRNDKLVSEVRRKLTAYPPVNRFYKRVITEINTKTPAVSIDSILEGRGRGVLVGTYTVPGSFTLVGFRQHMTEAIESAADEISKDDWVMGAAAGGAQTQSTDISKLQSMYLRDYTDQWRRFIRGVSVQPFKTKDDAVAALKALSATDSPMERVMLEVARNTNFAAKDENAGWWAWIKSFFRRDQSGEGGGNTEVEREFKPLFQFVSSGDEKKETSQMSQYRAELRRVLEPLEGSSADQLAQTSKALLTGKDDIGLQKANQVITGMLEAFKTAAAEDVAALLKQPLNNLRAMLFGGGYEQIDKGWREQIYPRAKAFESGFPFTEAGEASLTDLARFLNPANGQFTVYFNERLASSFDDAQGQWKLKEAGAFRFSDEFVAYLNNARRLREALFPSGGQQPEVSYDITLEAVPNTDIVIEIDGTRVETRGTSPQSAKFIWPTRAGSSGARISVIPSGGLSGEKTYPGEWGLLRMFAAGAPSQSGENQFTLTWNIGSVPVRAVLRPSSANHPFRRQLFTSMRAPQNLQK